MVAKKTKRNGLELIRAAEKTVGQTAGKRANRNSLRKENVQGAARHGSPTNRYLSAIETNQNGKYNVRIRAIFGKDEWTLGIYFLASTFNGAMKKFEESLQFLQRNEERLRFWGVERTDDPNLAGDFLNESGLRMDRRKDPPRKVIELALPSERPLTAALLGPVRRSLADSVAIGRFSAAAGS